MFTEVFVEVLPLFMGMLLGFLSSFARPFRENFEPAITAFVFYVALPALLFKVSAEADLSQGVPFSFLVLTFLSSVGFFALMLMLLRFTHRRCASSALALGMASSYGNVAYLGIPVVIGVLGTSGGLPAVIGQLAHNLIFLLGYPIIAGMQKREGTMAERKIRNRESMRKATLGSPLLWAVAAGLLLSGLDLHMPETVMNFADMFASAAAPAALFTIGLTLRGALQVIGGGNAPLAPALTAGLGKLVLMPTLAWVMVVLLAPTLEPAWVTTLVLMAAMPTSASAYILAQSYGGNGRLVASVILTTNAFGILTVPLVASYLL